MLARTIIPYLDVDAGRVKKGVRFVELRDAGDPVEVAAEYDRQGADEICFLDITASSEGRQVAHASNSSVWAWGLWRNSQACQ